MKLGNKMSEVREIKVQVKLHCPIEEMRIIKLLSPSYQNKRHTSSVYHNEVIQVSDTSFTNNCLFFNYLNINPQQLKFHHQETKKIYK